MHRSTNRILIQPLEQRVHLAAVLPDYNTGTGFFVLDGKIYDANGIEFIMKGPNNNHAWGSYVSNYNAIDHIARTGANATRAVMYQNIAADPTNNWTDSTDTVARRKEVAERYLANGIVPIVEDHASIQDSSSQSNPAALHEITTHWLDNASWLKQYERYVILNIANEWGPPAGADGANTLWRDSYITQVARLRAGPDGNLATESDNVNALLMIDAGQWGQDLNTLRLHAQQVLDADPQHNIVFSIHLYGQWRADDRPWEVNGAANSDFGPWDARSRLGALRDAGLPLVVGEWAWEDFRDFSNLGAPYGAYRTRNIMEICHDLGIGWLGWSWNHSSPTTLNMIAGAIQNFQYTSNTNLTEWGNWIVNEPELGTKASLRATVFPAAGLPNPTTPGLSPLPSNMLPDARLLLESTSVNIPESGQGVARVKLSRQPASNVIVNISKVNGGSNDADLDLVTTSLLFTTQNWNEYQPIILSAAADADSATGTARFEITGAGVLAADFIAKEIEPPSGAGPIVVNPDRDRLYNGSGTATSVTVTSAYPPVGAPNGTFFMRFNLAAVTGRIASATLRVFTTNTTANRFVRVFAALGDSWTEGSSAGINASFPLSGTGFALPTNGGSYLDISFAALTEFVRAEHFKDGIVSLALRMVSNTAVFQTDEGVNRPQLMLSTVEAVPPQVIASSFDYLSNPNRLVFTFSEDVSASLGQPDVLLESLTDPSVTLLLNSPAYDGATNTASFAIAPGIMPDGNYRATLLASGIHDAAANVMLVNSSLDFFTLAGDANRDRKVDVADLGILASNWQQSPRTFSQADFNYDGVVDVADLGILASSWQRQLTAPSGALAGSSAPLTTAPRAVTRPTRMVDQIGL